MIAVRAEEQAELSLDVDVESNFLAQSRLIQRSVRKSFKTYLLRSLLAGLLLRPTRQRREGCGTYSGYSHRLPPKALSCEIQGASLAYATIEARGWLEPGKNRKPLDSGRRRFEKAPPVASTKRLILGVLFCAQRVRKTCSSFTAHRRFSSPRFGQHCCSQNRQPGGMFSFLEHDVSSTD